MPVIHGRKIAEKIRKRVKKEVAKLKPRPGLAAILIGKNPASQIYIRLKERACRESNIYFEKHLLPANISCQKVIDLIHRLNQKKKIHGILIQFPLPRHLNAEKIVAAINPKKDVDGFHPENIKNLFANKSCLVSPVLSGVMELIKSTKIKTAGLPTGRQAKKALILANNEIFARPLAKLLEKKKILPNIFFTSEWGELKSKSNLKALKNTARLADVLIVALGRPRFITADMVKKNAVVIDVGYNLIKRKSVGDVDFESVSKKVAFITPVPGGVGPMTVAMLLKNVLKAYKLFN